MAIILDKIIEIIDNGDIENDSNLPYEWIEDTYDWHLYAGWTPNIFDMSKYEYGSWMQVEGVAVRNKRLTTPLVFRNGNFHSVRSRRVRWCVTVWFINAKIVPAQQKNTWRNYARNTWKTISRV